MPALPIVQLSRLDLVFILVVTVAAAFFRLYQLASIPPGLHYDEAFEGLVAKQLIETGHFKIFFEGNFGLEPLSVYFLAGLYLIFGASITTIRLMPAIAGILTVPASYLLVREMFPRGPWLLPDKALNLSGESLSRIVALLSSLSLAILYWHLTFSRYGVESNLLPLFEVITFYFLFRGFRTKHLLDFALCGVLLGLSIYTYQAARMLPFVMALFFVYRILLEWQSFIKTYWRGLAALIIMGLIAFAPLGYYFWNYPQFLTLRANQVTVVNRSQNPTQTVAANISKTLVMFLVRGDEDPRSNLPGRPAIDPILAIPFLLGAAFAVQRLGRHQYGFLFIWFVTMLIPMALTENAPNFRRALGVTPDLAILEALGLVGVLTAGYWVANQFRNKATEALRGVAIVAVIAAVASSAFITYRDYFLVWSRSKDLFAAFDVGILDLARDAAGLPPDTRVYLSPIPHSHPTIEFSMKNRRHMRSFDGRRGFVFPARSDVDAMYIVVTNEDSHSLPLLRDYFPQGRAVQEDETWDGRPYFTFYFVPGGSQPRPRPHYPLEKNLDNKIKFLGYNMPRFSYDPGDVIPLTIYWQALDTMDESYTVFTHLLGPWDEKNKTVIWGQEDTLPLGGAYLTNQWDDGDVVLDQYAIPIREDAPPGEYQIEVGMYLLDTMKRLQVVESTTGKVVDDRIVLDKIRIDRR